MAILKGYGVGKNLLAFIKRIWDGDTLVLKHKKGSLWSHLM
jgi:hypothetical protein